MKHIEPLFKLVEMQRATLTAFEPFEHDIDGFLNIERQQALKLVQFAKQAGVAVRVSVPETFETLYGDFHHNLDRAESMLKIACAVGMPLDISDKPVAHDIRCIGEPKRVGAPYGSKQRARDNLFATDFHDECGYMPEHGVHVSKVTIPQWRPVDSQLSISEIAVRFANPLYKTFVIASFEDPQDALLYKMTVA